MNDNEMRGCARASEVIQALETTYTGLDLLGALLVERNHAASIASNTRDQSIAEEWKWRANLYNAAYRRHEESYDVAA